MPGAGGLFPRGSGARCSTVLRDFRRAQSKISLACAATGRGTGAGRERVRHKHTARPGVSLQPSTRDRQAQVQNHGQSQSRWVRRGGRTSVSSRSGRTGNPGADDEELIVQQVDKPPQLLVALAEASAFAISPTRETARDSEREGEQL
jgi:hypothetical protein